MNPTIFNSKSKLGAVMLALVVLAQLWLPVFGIEITGNEWDKIFRSFEIIAVVLTAFGIRDAIFKTQAEVLLTKKEEKK